MNESDETIKVDDKTVEINPRYSLVCPQHSSMHHSDCHGHSLALSRNDEVFSTIYIAHGADRRNQSPRYAIDLVRATRPRDESGSRFRQKVCELRRQRTRGTVPGSFGEGPRLDERAAWHVSYEDIRALFTPVLRHRLLLNFHAESDRLTQDDLLKQILDWKGAPKA